MFTIKDKKEGENSTIELSVVIPEADLLKHRAAALKHIGEHAELPGFRKGHIPDNILVQKFGEQAVLEESAELAIEEHYADIVMETKAQPVAHPKIVITKIATGNPLEFTLTIEVMPQFKLPDYKTLAKKANKKEKIEVTEKEIEDVVGQIKKMQATETEGEKELDDAFVQTLGDFKDVTDFKAKMVENLKHEKELQAAQKNRIGILNAIAEKTTIQVPDTFIERELDQMTAEFTHELSRMGQTYEGYQTHAKKTDVEIRGEWRDKARTRVAQELLLAQIAKEENIKPDAEVLENEIAKMKEHYPDAPSERITSFVEDMLTKQEVFKFLEAQN